MYYIKSKKTGEYQSFYHEDGWYDADNETTWGGYWFLVDDSREWASEFDSYDQALIAIQDADESLDDYEIVLEPEYDTSQDEKWDNGELGRSEEHVKVSSIKELNIGED